MRPLHEQVNINGASTVYIKWDDFPYFTFPLHYHSEFEIVYVLKSFGMRYVGDNVENFTEGDLVLLGSNLPHFWKNDQVFYENNPHFYVNAVVVQFPGYLPGLNSNNLPEFKNIQELLKRAEQGVHFGMPDAIKIGSKLRKLLRKNGFERYIGFLKILEMMASSNNYRLLASPAMKQNLSIGIDNRLAKILIYLRNNFTHEIKLAKLAQIAGMNHTSFCRYFKKSTGKTIFEHLQEIRIGHACKLILQGTNSISEIAYMCGFNNISNFNRSFKKKTSFTPREYQKKIFES